VFTYLRNYTLEDLQQHSCGYMIFAKYFKTLQRERSTDFRKTNLSVITEDLPAEMAATYTQSENSVLSGAQKYKPMR
jgi:hypothetical protein